MHFRTSQLKIHNEKEHGCFSEIHKVGGKCLTEGFLLTQVPYGSADPLTSEWARPPLDRTPPLGRFLMIIGKPPY